VVKIFEATAAMTGLSETAARAAGFDVGVAVIHKDHHASYYPGGQELALKLVYDRKSARVLGGQAFGHAGVEKRIDVLATALHGKMTVHDLAELDLSYAPPYSSANDPVNLVAFVAENDLSGFSPLITAHGSRPSWPPPRRRWSWTYAAPRSSSAATCKVAMHVPVDELRGRLHELPRDRPLVVACRSGFRGHLALRILVQSGFGAVQNLTGGWVSVEAEGGFAVESGEARAPV
jgi:rhodanese-related sulfurtransferase